MTHLLQSDGVTNPRPQARKEIISDAAEEGRELTPVNDVNFKAWKKRKVQEKRAAHRKDMARQAELLKAGSQVGVSGKDLFKSGHAKSTDVFLTWA